MYINTRCSEKLDGVRAIWDGETFYSRAGNEYTAPDFFKKDLPKDKMLDGELFLERGEFQKCVSIVRKDVPNHAEWATIKYCVFDAIVDAGSTDPGFEARMKTCAQLVKGKKHAVYHPQEKMPAKQEDTVKLLDKKLKDILKDKGEGLMLRQPGSEYQGKRSKTLLKIKQFTDMDAKVTGHENGTGKYNGMMGACLCVDKDGNTFKVGTGFNDNDRGDPPKVGSYIEIKYQEKTKDNKPRFPVFLRRRPDLKKFQ